jgi:hypothetical protein
MRMRKLLLVAMLASVVTPITSPAEDDGICRIPLDEASVTTPHAEDESNDWGGAVFGSGNASQPEGDIYREAIDIQAAWLSYAENGTVQGNIKVADLGEGVMVNAIFYMLWTYGDGADAQRWASARFKGYAMAWTYGYKTVNTVTGNPQFFTVGETTGNVDLAADSISIDTPAGTAWGNPDPGVEIYGINAESALLVGSPETLPPNPTQLRHGQVHDTDLTDGWCLGIS